MSKLSSSSLFSVQDFRQYLRAWGRARGRGEFRKISLSLKIHTTLISQILNGKKSLTEAQASRMCSYMGLSALETDYFLKLVQIDRAETEQLKAIYTRHLNQLRAQASEAKSRVPDAREMSEQDRAIFYSTWHYSLIRLLTSISGFQTVEMIARHLHLSVSRVQGILDFLVSRGLCEERSGRYSRTEKNTHIEARSPLAIRHHQNWRVQALGFLEHMTETDLAFTAPVAISRKDASKVRELLLDTVSEIAKIIENSASEEVIYFGIDWIKT